MFWYYLEWFMIVFVLFEWCVYTVRALALYSDLSLFGLFCRQNIRLLGQFWRFFHSNYICFCYTVPFVHNSWEKIGSEICFRSFFCVFFKKKLEFFIFCFSKRHLIIIGNFVCSFPLSIRFYYDFYGKNHFCKLFVYLIRKQNKKIFVEEKTERKMMRG